MLTVIAAIIGAIGNGISGFFGFKGDQAKAVQSALDLLNSVDSNDAKQAAACAQALQVILTQGIWLEKVWRPMLMIILMGIIGSYWFFGYIPPHFNDSMSPMMAEIFGLLKIGLIGYIPGRTLEKIMTNMQISSVLKTLIQKKLS